VARETLNVVAGGDDQYDKLFKLTLENTRPGSHVAGGLPGASWYSLTRRDNAPPEAMKMTVHPAGIMVFGVLCGLLAVSIAHPAWMPLAEAVATVFILLSLAGLFLHRANRTRSE
jgi:hypothetical protein